MRAIFDIRQHSSKHTCGPDGISARIIHKCRDALAVPLLKICSLSLRRGVFPDAFKRANVVPIFKYGNVKDPNLTAICLY